MEDTTLPGKKGFMSKKKTFLRIFSNSIFLPYFFRIHIGEKGCRSWAVKNILGGLVMKTRKNVLMAIAAIMLLAGLPAFAKGNKEDQIKADLIIGNGTGGEITTLIISPAKAKYPKNKNRLAFQGLAISDTATFAVALPNELKGIDTFDIEMISGRKHYKTKKGVNINFKSGKLPTLELSRNGKDSTRAIIGAAAGGVGGVVAVAATATALYTGTIMIGQALYVAALAEALCVAGSIVGGGMLSGIGVVAAIPVAFVTGGFLVGRALTPGGLDVQVYYN